ncbi:MAG: hypothetical protein SWH68_10355 [Thermodesulfobacteriota bacterium]|nr:hypothetical protein [Thermodesulfobacteriota bacterium]
MILAKHAKIAENKKKSLAIWAAWQAQISIWFPDCCEGTGKIGNCTATRAQLLAAQPSRAGFFRKTRADCVSRRGLTHLYKIIGEFLPAPKKPPLRGKPEAKLLGALSFA